MERERSRIAFIIPQFGIFPDYVHYFIRSASYSAGTIDLIFISDQKNKIDYGAANVYFHEMTLPEFSRLCREKLRIDCTLSRGYKLCDLKPMYGLIFEDYLKGYEYWAHGDFDMILGDVPELLRRNEFDRFDIFSVQQLYASGPFQVFRNIEKVNRFFMQSSSWKEVLGYPDYAGFDEAGDVIRELWKGKSIRECQGKIQSMTHLMKNEGLLRRLDIRVSMRELITEHFKDGTSLNFDRGKLILQPGGEELYIYHFMNRKNRSVFNDLLLDKKAAIFVFSGKGFYTGKKIELYIGLWYSLMRRYWIRFVKKVRP